jgi:hypothetical protein
VEVDSEPILIAVLVLREAPDVGIGVNLANQFDVAGEDGAVTAILGRIAVQNKHSHGGAFRLGFAPKITL